MAGAWNCAACCAAERKQNREFQPILSDVRELVGRMANDREDAPGQWTAERLKQTLNRHLHGEKIVILANREPYIHQHTADGRIEVQHPASGLVTALEPVMRACSGVWVAHGSGNADRETVDRNDHVRVPPGEESYHIRRVWLSEEEQQGYYYGFSNEGLWPLCHVAHARPDIPRGGLAAVPRRQSEVRRRGLQRSGLQRSDHPGAGLSLRPRARDDSQAPARRNRHRVLAHSVAQRRTNGNLSLAQ